MAVAEKPNNNFVERKNSEYLAQLLNDKKQLQALPNVFVHVEKILDEEINRVRSSLFHWSTNKEQQQLPDPCGPVVTLTEKLFVPLHEHPDFNFVGRILGPRGMTAKQLEMDTGCKIMVRGKGSMRDKLKEEQNRGKPNWEHLNEDLHVLISVDDTENRATLKLMRAVDEVKKLLVPMADGEDELKKMQLLELAIMNGTYREALPPAGATFVINTPQGPRVVATAQPVGMPSMPSMLQQTTVLQHSAMTAGTPIILAPRIQTPQLASVTSLPSQPVLAAGSRTPSVVTPASPATVPTSGLVYSYDTAYLQRMLDYSAAVDASAVGPVPKLRRTVAVRDHPYTRGLGPLM